MRNLAHSKNCGDLQWVDTELPGKDGIERAPAVPNMQSAIT